MGWSPDSSQFKTYAHLADELSNDSLRKELGLPTSDTEQVVIGKPTLDRCPECSDELPEGSERCLSCDAPLTHKDAVEQELQEELEDRAFEHARQAEPGSDEAAVVAQFREAVKKNPEVAAEVVEVAAEVLEDNDQ